MNAREKSIQTKESRFVRYVCTTYKSDHSGRSFIPCEEVYNFISVSKIKGMDLMLLLHTIFWLAENWNSHALFYIFFSPLNIPFSSQKVTAHLFTKTLPHIMNDTSNIFFSMPTCAFYKYDTTHFLIFWFFDFFFFFSLLFFSSSINPFELKH